MTPPEASGTGPLAGVTVVECSSIVLGPLTGQHLGDMGADVIKVEPPEGDLTRSIGPRRSDKQSALFVTTNRNKRSMVIDLKSPEGRATMHTLLGAADVFLHSLRSDPASRLGLTYEDLAGRYPALVYCQVQGFSDAGPYGGQPAYDDIIQALSGLAALQTVVAGRPRYVPTIIADKVTAVHAAYGIALALFSRERTGRGQKIQVPMFETMVAFTMVEHLWGHAFEPPLGPLGYEPVSTASRRPFATEDGYLSFMPYSDGQWVRFLTLVDREDLASDPRFATIAGRQQNVTLVWDELAHQLSKRTTAEWVELLGPEDMPMAAVNNLEDLLTDPHLEEIGFWSLIDDAEDGRMRFPANPLAMARTPATLRRLPPRLGEHTEEILAELGIGP